MSEESDLRPVVTRLAGGLGNQMFQYAAGYALAEHLRVPLLLDTGLLEARPAGMSWTPRDYALNVFNLDARFATADLVAHLEGDATDEPWLRVMHWIGLARHGSRLVERSKHFDPDFFDQAPPVLLQGHWQCERYFASVAGELRDRVFTPRAAPSELNRRTADGMRAHNGASVHVRRGDYITNPEAAQYHGVCTPEYYRSAAEELIRMRGVHHFYLFTDDVAWVREHIRLPAPTTIIEHNAGTESHWDLWLMRHCKHHIIANSSFSWWGAWLADPEDRTVIAPKRWFADPSLLYDILPTAWLAR